MGTYRENWDEIGKNIQSLVDEAIRSQDYQKLNQTVRQTVNKTIDLGSNTIKKAVSSVRYTSAPGTSRTVDADKVTVESGNAPALYGSSNRKTVAGILKVVGGSLVGLFSFLGLVSSCRGLPSLLWHGHFLAWPCGRCFSPDGRNSDSWHGEQIQHL